MPEKDKFVSLVSRSTFACSLLVSPDESDVQLLDTNYPEDGIVDLARDWAPRQLRWVGAIAMVDGKSGVALAEPLSPQCLGRIIVAFEDQYYDSRFAAQQEIDELESLFLLPDTRPN